MERISAAENLTIEMSKTQWRLIINGTAESRVLLEAAPGRPLNYPPAFATSRRLPAEGHLATDQIQRVVLGWSPSDEAWHLGLLLDNALAQPRGGSRWCEIAHWPDPNTNVFDALATQAGTALAEVVERPFHVVPPKPAAPPLPPPLPDLPLPLDDLWTLEQADHLQVVRHPSWARATVRRILWYVLWTVVYFLLIYATFTSGIAPANPAFLPYLGLVAAFILIGLIIKNIYLLRARPNRIEFDVRQRQVRGQRGKHTLWSLRANELQSIYVSQVIGKRRGKAAAVQYGEMNLLLVNGRFRHLFNTENVPELEPILPVEAEAVTSLEPGQVKTALEAAALYVAQTLDIPAMHDQRRQ
jgi:hypothetical protein